MPRVSMDKGDAVAMKKTSSKTSYSQNSENKYPQVTIRVTTPTRMRESLSNDRIIVASPTQATPPSVNFNVKSKSISNSKPEYQRRNSVGYDNNFYSSSPNSNSSSTSAKENINSPVRIKTMPILVPVRTNINEQTVAMKNSAVSLKSPTPISPRNYTASKPMMVQNSVISDDLLCKNCLSTSQTSQPNETISIEAQANDRAFRKIMDLEISNTSLLAVNNSLETTIRKQAQTIERLKSQIIHFSVSVRDLETPNDTTDEQVEDDNESIAEEDLESPDLLDSSQGYPIIGESEIEDTPENIIKSESEHTDESEMIYQRICDKVTELIHDCQNALINQNALFLSSPDANKDVDQSIRKNIEDDVINTLSSKLTTVLAIRNQTYENNKVIAGVSQSVDNQQLTGETWLKNLTRTVELPLPVYSQICTLLEDLHVESMYGQPFSQISGDMIYGNEMSSRQKSIPRRPVVESLVQPYLDDPYLTFEKQKQSSRTNFRVKSEEMIGARPKSAQSQRVSTSHSRNGSYGQSINFTYPKLQSFNGAESTLSSVVGRR